MLAPLLGTCLLAPAAASLIPVASYDMLNGGSGTYNYWDDSYDGAGSRTTDYAALTGGTGQLTDGIIASAPYSVVEPAAGPGPYVGWRYNVFGGPYIYPVITFSFAGDYSFDQAVIHFDDADGQGGVDHIQRVDVAQRGVQSFGDPAGSGPTSIGVDLTGLSGNVVSLQLVGADQWQFVSEIEFFGSSLAVPAPGALGLVGLGTFAAASLRRRRSWRA
ncbi:hypothetical protein B5C34_12970 [Pacificimonas flava]|uniref:Discoidin domain-containing protein n=1 Tax=Pacificimonas flava TaxID=1234595 RepID=A0A219B933_9SPHN|nr:hypothetical protein B5C34_12970 [Pacificimonas flava]